jgi:hypothetical protein
MKPLGNIRNVSVRNLEFFGILVGFYLGEIKFGWEFKFESILRPKEN